MSRKITKPGINVFLKNKLEQEKFPKLCDSQMAFSDIVSPYECEENSQKEKPTKVSAIVSSYNSQFFIKDCLEDLIDQTLFEKGMLEIVVIDSASPQQEGKIVKDFQGRYQNIAYIRTDQRETIYQAWNRGIQAARGEYVTSANTDDRHRADALEVMAAALDANPKIALVYGDVFVTNLPNQSFSEHIRCGYHIRPDFSPEIMLSGCHMGPQPMWRKSAHQHIGWFNEKLCSAGDYEFWCRIAVNWNMLHIPEFLGLYYENPKGLCNSDVRLSVKETNFIQNIFAKQFPHPKHCYTRNLQYRGRYDPGTYVNICIITANHLEFTRQSIDALILNTDFPYVLTVVDNASSDGTRNYLEELKCRGVIKNLVRLDDKTGVGKASNLAWSMEPDAEYFLKLENEIVIKKAGWLTKMVGLTKEIPEVGTVAYDFNRQKEPVEFFRGIPIRRNNAGYFGSSCILLSKRSLGIFGDLQEDCELCEREGFDLDKRIFLNGLMNVSMDVGGIGARFQSSFASEIGGRSLKIHCGERKHLADLRQPIDIVILSYNRLSYFKKTIDCLYKETRYPFRVIIVDNASDGKFKKFLHETSQRYAHLILNETNYFTYAFQQGINLSVSDPFVVCDPDILVPAFDGPCWLERLLNLHVRYPDMGLIALNLDRSNLPPKVPDVYLSDKKPYGDELILSNVGTVMQCIKRKYFTRAYTTDWEVCEMIRKNGGKVGFAKNIVAYHLGWNEEKDYPDYLVKKHYLVKDKYNSDLYTLNTCDPILLQAMSRKTTTFELFEKDSISLENLVSIVILTFNQLQYSQKCFESIQSFTPESHEIIFVDNGSSDGTVEWLNTLVHADPHVRLVANRVNLGFAKGCNQGIRAAKGRCILLLNNDTVVTAGWLSGLREVLDRGPDIGIVGPMTNSASGVQVVANPGYGTLNELPVWAATFRERNRHRRIPHRRIVGFCMLFKRRLVDDIGGLDESFGTGNFEDDDFCLRAVVAGYRNLIAGDVFIHHYGSRSFIGNKIDYRTSISGNKKIFSSKWYRIDPKGPLGKKALVISALERADSLNREGQLDLAVSVLIKALRQVPEERELSFRLAEIMIEAKSFNYANAILEAMATDEGARKFALIGLCAEGLKQYDKADQNSELALLHEPSNVQALNLKGTLAYRKGDKEAAERFFKTAVDIDPGFGESHTNLGVMKWDSGEVTEAVGLFERGFILSPTTPDIVCAYHMAIAETKAFARAESFFREAAALFPGDKRISFLLIAILMQQEKYSQAMLETERAIDKFGANEGILSAALKIRERIEEEQVAS